jgi:hypothetical protein
MNSTKEKMNRAYIDSKLAQIFEPMVNQIFAKNPDDLVIYMQIIKSD